jgi:hypothetical protein
VYGDRVTDAVLPPALRHEVAWLAPADVVVALSPAADEAAAGHCIAAIQVGLARLLPTARAVVLTAGEPRAGEPAVAAGTLGADAVAAALLRAPATEVRRLHVATADARERWLRLAVEAGSAVGARAVVVLDGDLRWAVPEWIDALAGPLLDGMADLVLPVGARHRFDAVPDAIFATPLTRSLYGRRVAAVGGGPLGIGQSLFEPLLAAGDCDAAPGIATLALATGARVIETQLGVLADVVPPDAVAAATRLGAAVLAASARHADAWQRVRGSEELLRGGFPRRGEAPPVRVDPVEWLGTFAEAASTRREAWAAILSTATLKSVLGLAVTAAGVGLSARDWLNLDRGADIGRLETATLAGAMATFHFPDDTWVGVVHDALVATGPGGVPLADVAAALAPVLLGRAASFVVEARLARPDEVATLLERQAAAFERSKPGLVARWSAPVAALA